MVGVDRAKLLCAQESELSVGYWALSHSWISCAHFNHNYWTTYTKVPHTRLKQA